MELNLTHLRYLHAAVRTGSFSEAARMAHVSPQAVAKAVHALESELEMPLFTSSGRGVAPTEFAIAIAPQLGDALRQFDDFLHCVEARRSATEARGFIALGVATSPHRCSVLAHSDFDAFGKRHPFCQLNVQLHTNELCAASLKEGLIDAAVVYGGVQLPDAECRTIGRLRLFATMLYAHPLASKQEVTLHDLHGRLVATPLDERYVFPRLIRECRRAEVKPRFLKIDAAPDAARAFIAHGGLVLTALRENAGKFHPGAVEIPFRCEGGFDVPMRLAYRKRDEARLQALYAYLLDLRKKKAEAFDPHMPLKNSSGETASPSSILPSESMRISS